jgi:hypothetical protein
MVSPHASIGTARSFIDGKDRAGTGVLAALLTVGALFYTVLAWKNGYWSVAYRAYYSLATVAAIAFVWFLHYWNWLGWRY